MAIKTGRYGQVKWDPTGGTATVAILSLNAWTGNFETEFEDVSCFGDQTRVYVPGLKNAEGTLAGFWNSSSVILFEAADATTPGKIELYPNYTEAAYYWSGLAYMNASIDASLGAPKVSGTWKAAGNFARYPQITATGATAGAPGTWTPAGAVPKANLAAMTGVTATPATAWTTGQHMILQDATLCHWNATAWVAGAKP